MPCLRHTSAVFAPASCSCRTAMICSSLNRLRFIVRPPSGGRTLLKSGGASGAQVKRMTDYLGVSEKTEALAEFFRSKRTDQLSSHDWRRRQTIADNDWNDDETTVFANPCGELT